jgi:hypothetical protein
MDRSTYAISAHSLVHGTEVGAELSLRELQLTVGGEPGDICKRIGVPHSRHFLSQQLSGEKPMPLSTFDALLGYVSKRRGREAVRRIFDAWLSRFGMCAVDRSTRSLTLVPKDALLETAVAVSHLVTVVDDAMKNELIDARESRLITESGDAAVGSIRELEEATCGGGR